jgi:hypothetical protein
MSSPLLSVSISPYFFFSLHPSLFIYLFTLSLSLQLSRADNATPLYPQKLAKLRRQTGAVAR